MVHLQPTHNRSRIDCDAILSRAQGLPLAGCTFFYKFDLALSYGVTVAQQILNLFVLVRIQVAQLSRPGKSGSFFMELLG